MKDLYFSDTVSRFQMRFDSTHPSIVVHPVCGIVRGMRSDTIHVSVSKGRLHDPYQAWEFWCWYHEALTCCLASTDGKIVLEIRDV